ncbi:hypothetical protein [Streptomyces coeruleorubidus]
MSRGETGAIAARWAFTYGKPGSRSSSLTRGSGSRARWSACRVTNQGVLPFQIRTRVIGFSDRSSCAAGAGASGHSAARGSGYSGSGPEAPVTGQARASDMTSPQRWGRGSRPHPGRGAVAEGGVN